MLEFQTAKVRARLQPQKTRASENFRCQNSLSEKYLEEHLRSRVREWEEEKLHIMTNERASVWCSFIHVRIEHHALHQQSL